MPMVEVSNGGTDIPDTFINLASGSGPSNPITYTATRDYPIMTVFTNGHFGNYCNCTTTAGTLVFIGGGGVSSSSSSNYAMAWIILNVPKDAVIRVTFPNSSGVSGTLKGTAE